MHPLSIFPSLLVFELLSPFLIRIAVSLFVIYLGSKRYKKEYRQTSFLYFASGALVFLGLYTQIAVLVAIATLKLDFYLDFWKNRKVVPISKETYFLYIISEVILLSLLFTGPGFLAFDWPL